MNPKDGVTMPSNIEIENDKCFMINLFLINRYVVVCCAMMPLDNRDLIEANGNVNFKIANSINRVTELPVQKEPL